MALPDFLLFLLLSAAFCCSSSADQLNRQNITLGSLLTPTGTQNSNWLSPSGLYAFGFYSHPNTNAFYVGIFLAGIPEKTVVWTANRDDPPLSSNVTLLLADNGQLILQKPNGETTPLIMEAPSSATASASMLDSGNFVLYNSSGEPIWQSFDYPTDTILTTQSLANNKVLYSAESKTNPATGYFKLSMQMDGNLVQYPVQWPESVSSAYFSTPTYNLGKVITLNLDTNGHLYLFNSNSTAIMLNFTNGFADDDGKLYLMRIDSDGILRLYSHASSNWSVLWSSTTDLCDPKGLCGLNGYCVLLDNVADCRCLPGFDFVNTGNWSSGCERDFNVESCKSNDTQVTHTMTSISSTTWEENSYWVGSQINQQACEQACLDDCNCQVALYKDGQCMKQRLPLRYGRLETGDSNMALVKTQTRTGDGNSNDVPPKQEKRHPVDVILIISSSLVALTFIFLIATGFLLYRSRRLSGYKKLTRPSIVGLGDDIAPREFSYIELEQITDGFKEQVGKGTSGVVYKGTLPHNRKFIAVKKLEKISKESEMEFLNEMKVIGKTHHRNLVGLVGYSLDNTNKLLAIEYMSNGSLADLLFKTEKRPHWDERTRFMLEVIKGILYLHEECETQIIHCGIKPENILLDEYNVIKISDFGMAKLLKHDQTKTYSGTRGTKGYLAPEWFKNLPITVKADVYSFGVVLLEIITCRPCLNWNLSEEEAVLVDWVYLCFETNELQKLVGDEEDVDMKMLKRMVKVGIWCIQEEPSLRPTMKKVLLMLEGTVEIPVPPSPTSFFSII